MLILMPLCLIFAALVLQNEEKKQYVPAAVFKALASICFVILGFLCAHGGRTSVLLLIGLIFGAVADVLLNLRNVMTEKGRLIFLVGILVFLLGHIMYLAAVLPLIRLKLAAVLVGVVFTAGLMKWIFTKITAEKAFKAFGIVYVGAITILNVAALFNLVEHLTPFAAYFMIGALLFLVSDIILILNTFGEESKLKLRVVNLTLYYIGQLLIAFSLSVL